MGRETFVAILKSRSSILTLAKLEEQKRYREKLKQQIEEQNKKDCVVVSNERVKCRFNYKSKHDLCDAIEKVRSKLAEKWCSKFRRENDCRMEYLKHLGEGIFEICFTFYPCEIKDEQ